MWLLDRCSVPWTYLDQPEFPGKSKIIFKILSFLTLVTTSWVSMFNGTFENKFWADEKSSSDVTPGDVSYIDVKCCADSESVFISHIRRPVFALSSKNRRFESILKIIMIWLAHVKERTKTRLGRLKPVSRMLGFRDLQGQTWQKIGKKRQKWPKKADFCATGNAITL